MLSIIVSSINPQQFDQFSENVQHSIGIGYEIIQIPNSKGERSLAEVYNEGASQSQFPYLLFIHEDIYFKTSNWGKNLIQHFEALPEMGLMGVIGSTIKSKMVSNWALQDLREEEPERGQIIQQFKHQDAKDIYWNWNPNNVAHYEVVTIDGVFMATRKEIWKVNSFDEKLLKNFHGYDLDFSLQIGQTYKVFVAMDILIQHLSEGIYGLEWLEETLKVHQKWNSILPKTVDPKISTEKINQIQDRLLKENCGRIILSGLSLPNSLSLMSKIIGLIYPQPSLNNGFWRVKTTLSILKAKLTTRN